MTWLVRLLNKHTRIDQYREDALDWGTCAVGESADVLSDRPLIALVPRSANAPKDSELDELGVAFAKAVSRNHRRRALALYFRIQRRVAKIAR